MIYFLLTALFFVVLLIYLKIADHYNIIDHPNERSSHTRVTIRGGGIVFLFAATGALVWHFEFYLPLCGILLISIISFLDDIYTLSNRIRILFHVASVSLFFIFLDVFALFSSWEIALLYILVIGIINAYNFMDGINGMTGLHSLVVLSGLQYVNLYKIKFITTDMIWLPTIACGVFLFFNFRKKAKCFAGDVGSITIALWIILLLLKLILVSHAWAYLLFLAVYGVDSILTIIHRLMLKQNIFKAHRSHLYQLLANEQRIPHLLVSSCYTLIQLLIIIFVVVNIELSPIKLFSILLLPLILFYMLLKTRLQKSNRAVKS
jgi:UDP-N-acetylmuramyl pentapeptide phosphotransferase/UDP-N-acetylglucosamine-1-phosphate transferase